MPKFTKVIPVEISIPVAVLMTGQTVELRGRLETVLHCRIPLSYLPNKLSILFNRKEKFPSGPVMPRASVTTDPMEMVQFRFTETPGIPNDPLAQ